MVTSDFLVVGGGIIGLNVARQLKRQFSDATVTVIEQKITVALTPVVEIAGCCTLVFIIHRKF